MKPILAIMKQPQKFLDIGDYTKVSKAFIADRWAVDLIALLNETGMIDKIEELPQDVISLIENMNILK